MNSEQKYDVVIVGGAMMGASIAAHLALSPDFDGTVAVVERDPSYEFSSTARSASSIRQQFSTEINIRISQYGADYIRNFAQRIGREDAPDIPFQSFGYMYLAGTPQGAAILRENQAVQSRLGVATRLLTPDQIAAEYPFYDLDGILLGSHNPVDEGYFDGSTMFEWWRRVARDLGVRFLTDEVTGLDYERGRITGVRLASGKRLSPGIVVNAAGPRGAAVAAMAGLALPVEPRRRFCFVFTAQDPLPAALPLTIDPSGIYVRQDGAGYHAGCAPLKDGPVTPDDFREDPEIWENHVWPALAARIPAFEAIRLRNSWTGHYAYNTLDQNAVIGPHPDIPNFLFCNGFSGHGFQQSPAIGRGIAEWITYERYVELDLSPLGYDRIAAGRPLLEKAII